MKQTPNLSLKKPELTDVVNIEDFNQNFDTIDTEIKGAKDKADQAFQSASNRDANTVNGHTVESNVPVNAKFTDTVYTHPTASGNKHVPTGGSSGQILRWSADGTAVWGADNDTVYAHPATHPPTILAAGTLPVGVIATNSTDYTTSRIRNAQIGTTIPTLLNNGEIFYVYE